MPNNDVDKIIKEFKIGQNYGLDLELEKQCLRDEDWKFGGDTILSCIAEIPEEERMQNLPDGEVQRGKEDMFDCATRGPINILETKFTWLLQNKKLDFEQEYWLRDRGYVDNERIKFSDAFIAILSGTTRNGNSMKAPLDAIRKKGLIPKKMLPLEEWMTWGDYHNPERITQKMRDLGLEFSERFNINYQIVYKEHFEELYKKDLLDIGGYAWPIPVNGIYPRTGKLPNHVFVGIKNPRYLVFDNYIDSVDGDFIKKLAPNYDLMDYGYRLLINFEKKPDFWGFLRNFFKKYRINLFQKDGTV